LERNSQTGKRGQGKKVNYQTGGERVPPGPPEYLREEIGNMRGKTE